MSQYSKVLTLFENLFENKASYREKFIGLVRLENVEIRPDFFSATAVPQLEVTPSFLSAKVLERGCLMPTEPWSFGGDLDYDGLLNHNKMFGGAYAGWTIWIEPDLIRAVELLARVERD
jgi:hypothetical protein